MAAKRSPPSPAPREVPAGVLAKLRAICSGLPETYEEPAWVGTRWMVRKRNFAHVLKIDRGRPAAYARAAGSDGPLVVLTFRTSAALRDVLRDAGLRFFVPAWGTKWGTKVVGLKLERSVDWNEVEMLLIESHRLLAPEKLRAAVRRSSPPRPARRVSRATSSSRARCRRAVRPQGRARSGDDVDVLAEVRGQIRS